MMKNGFAALEQKLDFSDAQTISPDEVIAKLGQQLEEVTKGLVRGVVKEYEEPIQSYNNRETWNAMMAALGSSLNYNKDIQEDLGVIGEDTFRFEFYLTSPRLEKYKYRILFFAYGIGNYPVKIVLEQGIADEIFGMENADYEIVYHTEEELSNAVLNILNSKKVIKVVQELIYTGKKLGRTDAGEKAGRIVTLPERPF